MKKSKTTTTNNQPEGKMLTDVELELMTILWYIGEGSVTQVMNELSQERELAYTSVSTILRILEQKEILKTRKEGRGHVYIPLMAKAEYEAKTVKHVVDRVFEGTPVSLVKRLLDTIDISDEDLKDIKKLIAKNERREK
ncbi:MAG: BlaI/MecI/CopY family transcriptional regulator [Oligoflexia bacterium]|nr:BlaI/MecI/CopY family transcriptional regulator [Oligoflexia bacterium]